MSKTISLLFPHHSDRYLGKITHWNQNRFDGTIDGQYFVNAQRILRFNTVSVGTTVEYERVGQSAVDAVVPYFNECPFGEIVEHVSFLTPKELATVHKDDIQGFFPLPPKSSQCEPGSTEALLTEEKSERDTFSADSSTATAALQPDTAFVQAQHPARLSSVVPASTASTPAVATARVARVSLPSSLVKHFVTRPVTLIGWRIPPPSLIDIDPFSLLSPSSRQAAGVPPLPAHSSLVAMQIHPSDNLEEIDLSAASPAADHAHNAASTVASDISSPDALLDCDVHLSSLPRLLLPHSMLLPRPFQPTTLPPENKPTLLTATLALCLARARARVLMSSTPPAATDAKESAATAPTIVQFDEAESDGESETEANGVSASAASVDVSGSGGAQAVLSKPREHGDHLGKQLEMPEKGLSRKQARIQRRQQARRLKWEAKQTQLPLAGTGALAETRLASWMEHTVVLSRNTLLKLLGSRNSGGIWVCYASRPLANGPVCIERDKGYPVFEGSVGRMFEAAAFKLPAGAQAYHKVYQVTSATFGSHRLLYSGEIDAVDESGATLEVKTKPFDATDDVEARFHEAWLQSFVSGTDRLVQCAFYRSPHGTVFDSHLHAPRIAHVRDEVARHSVIPHAFKQAVCARLAATLGAVERCVRDEAVYRLAFHPHSGLSVSRLLNERYAQTLFPSREQLQRCLDLDLDASVVSARCSESVASCS